MEKLSCWLCNRVFSSPLKLMFHTIAKHKEGESVVAAAKKVNP